MASLDMNSQTELWFAANPQRAESAQAQFHHPLFRETSLTDVPSSGSTMQYHEGCVIRNCIINGGDNGLSFDTRGIVVRGAVGTIVERNRIVNCTYGGPFELESSQSTPVTSFYRNKDVVVRENYFYNVLFALSLSVRNRGFKRLIVDRNWIELAVDASAGGILVTRVVDNDSNKAMDVLIARRNRIQHVNGASAPGNGPVGIDLRYVGEAIVQRNLIDVGDLSNPAPDDAVRHGNCTKVTCFNNQTSTARFLPGYDVGTQRHDAEFTTDVEDAVLAL